MVKMESSVSTPHCSFVVYLDEDADLLSTFFKDLHGFFQNFPIRYEVIAVCCENSSSAKFLQDYVPELKQSGALKMVFTKRKCSRAESLRQGLNQAEASFLFVTSAEISTPLGDLFKLLQHLMTDENIDIVFGERTSKRQMNRQMADSLRQKNEQFFARILQERRKFESTDPFCEVMGFRKSAWEKLNQGMGSASLRGWYLRLILETLLRGSPRPQVKSQEIFVYDSGRTSKSYPVWQARWQLLRQCLL